MNEWMILARLSMFENKFLRTSLDVKSYIADLKKQISSQGGGAVEFKISF